MNDAAVDEGGIESPVRSHILDVFVFFDTYRRACGRCSRGDYWQSQQSIRQETVSLLLSVTSGQHNLRKKIQKVSRPKLNCLTLEPQTQGADAAEVKEEGCVNCAT